MKKILVLVIAIAMLASLGVSAAATTQGAGTISFQIWDLDNDFPPGAGFANPGAVGSPPPYRPGIDLPAGGAGLLWPDFPGANMNNPTQMDSWDLAFGTRNWPITGPVRWGSHANAPGGVGPNVTTAPSSRLGILYNTDTLLGGSAPSWTLITPPNTSNSITVALAHFETGGALSLQNFTLLLSNHDDAGFLPTGGVSATGPGLAAGISRRTMADTVTPSTGRLVQGSTATTFGAAFRAVDFQTGIVGLEWYGVLDGTVTATNVLPGQAQAQILFNRIAYVP